MTKTQKLIHDAAKDMAFIFADNAKHGRLDDNAWQKLSNRFSAVPVWYRGLVFQEFRDMMPEDFAKELDFVRAKGNL